LETHADDVPYTTGFSAVTNRVELAAVRIGNTDVLLPQTAELTIRRLNGEELHNRVVFTHCRAYVVEATISFGPITTAPQHRADDNRPINLPPGLHLKIALDTPIDSITARVNDPVSGHIEAGVKHGSEIAIPADAVLSGRIRRIEQRAESTPTIRIYLEFSRLEFEGKRARFFAVLDDLVLPSGSDRVQREINDELPAIGIVSGTGNRIFLPPGTRMLWKTVAYK
jgi:hypothetical protein